MLSSSVLAWLDVDLTGSARALHVRWYEDGKLFRHDESWDEPLDPDEAQALLEFVLGTCSR
jgi:hypothetical protein